MIKPDVGRVSAVFFDRAIAKTHLKARVPAI